MNRAAVVQILSRVSRRRSSEIVDHLSLATLGLSSSLGLSLLRSELEAEAGSTIGIIDGKLKVGALIERLTNGALPASGSASAELAASAPRDTAQSATELPLGGASPPLLPAHVGLGLDIQDLASMPEASDFRAHPFYRDHFFPAEIATALLRPDARAHLCGIFCAKEAAKKSHPMLLNERMSSFLVSHDGAGKPSVRLLADHATASGFRFVLSISHTSSFAAAACMTFWS